MVSLYTTSTFLSESGEQVIVQLNYERQETAQFIGGTSVCVPAMNTEFVVKATARGIYGRPTKILGMSLRMNLGCGT